MSLEELASHFQSLSKRYRKGDIAPAYTRTTVLQTYCSKLLDPRTEDGRMLSVDSYCSRSATRRLYLAISTLEFRLHASVSQIAWFKIPPYMSGDDSLVLDL